MGGVKGEGEVGIDKVRRMGNGEMRIGDVFRGGLYRGC